MRNFGKWGLVGTSVVVCLVLGNVAGRAEDAAAVVKQRHALMKAQGGDLKAIGAFAKGEGDQATAQAKADDLVEQAKKIPASFPPGTSLTDYSDDNAAKPEIWANFDKFKSLAADLQGQTVKLAEAVKSGDKAAVGAQLGATGKACGACHNEFRQKEN
jgi:cytochrome c556